MSESPTPAKGIKQLIRSGNFTKRINLGRPRIPTPSLSTINSAGSYEEDANETDIDDDPEDKRASKADKHATTVSTKEVPDESSKSKPDEQSFAQRAIFAGMPTLIQTIGNRRSNPPAGSNRSSRTSIASSRTSQVSANAALPTIKEGPASPGLTSQYAIAVNVVEPATPSQHQDDSAVQGLSAPPAAQAVHTRSVSDTPSMASTLNGSEDSIGPKSMTPPLPQYSNRGTTSSTNTYRLASDTTSEKSGAKHSSYSCSVDTKRTSSSSGPNPPSYQGTFDEEKLPNSRFSWHRSNQDKAKDWWTRWFVEWWGIELISISLSGVCIIIIMSVLAGYNGKQLPAWHIGITINAFISIFAGFAKASLLLPTAEALGQLKWNWFTKKPRQMMDFEVLDGASRGAIGSFLMLAKTKGITLASVGAAIILLSLPLDLFFQQIVQYPTQWTATGTSSLSRAVVYDPTPDEFRDTAQLNSGSPSTNYSQSPDPVLGLTVYPMFYSDTPALPPLVTCNSQRCSWEPFETLGACGACAPLPSTSLEFGCQMTGNDWMNEVLWEPPTTGLSTNGGSSGNNGTVESCGWYFKPAKGLPMLVSGYAVDGGKATELLAGRLFPLRDPWTQAPIVPGATVMFPDIKAALQNIVISQTPDSLRGAATNSTPIVEECVLYWCVQTLQSGIGGEFGLNIQENITNIRQLNPTTEGDPWLSDEWFAPNYTLTLPDKFAGNGSQTSTYFVDNSTSRATLAIFDQLAPATFTANDTTSEPNFKYNFRWNFYRDLDGAPNPWLAPNNATAHFLKMISMMSTTMRRQQYDGKVSNVAGTAWNPVVIVHIHWAWIILPSILFIFSLLFLTLTMMKSQKAGSKVGIWKNSQLAVLFNGLGEDVQDIAPSNPRLGNVRQVARNTLVGLED